MITSSDNDLQRPRLTAVVVSKGLDMLLRVCSEALQRALARCAQLDGYTIVVVDNGSPTPYRAETLPGTTLMRFDKGQSFAAANNVAVEAWPASYYLLLNNDVWLDVAAVAHMVRAMEEAPSVGICGTRLLFPDGAIQHCGVVFGDQTGPYHVDRGRPTAVVPRRTREVQAVSGACLLVRHELWVALGGLDPAYRYGLEDIDFCLRARQRGWRVWCCNETDSLHFESMTPGRVGLDVASRALFTDRWRGRYTVDG